MNMYTKIVDNGVNAEALLAAYGLFGTIGEDSTNAGSSGPSVP